MRIQHHPAHNESLVHDGSLPGDAFLSLSQPLTGKESGMDAKDPGDGSGATAGSESHSGGPCLWVEGGVKSQRNSWSLGQAPEANTKLGSKMETGAPSQQSLGRQKMDSTWCC